MLTALTVNRRCSCSEASPKGGLAAVFGVFGACFMMLLFAAGRTTAVARLTYYKRKKPPEGGVKYLISFSYIWLREQDLNLRPSGYEPDELPGCSIPRQFVCPTALLLEDFVLSLNRCFFGSSSVRFFRLESFLFWYLLGLAVTYSPRA